MGDMNIDRDNVGRIIMLTYGKMEHGGPYWCYVAIKPSRFEEYKTAMASKQYNMQNFDLDGFGEIVVSGEGATPPQDVTQKVAALFDAPIRELFKDADPMATLDQKIQHLSGNPDA